MASRCSSFVRKGTRYTERKFYRPSAQPNTYFQRNRNAQDVLSAEFVDCAKSAVAECGLLCWYNEIHKQGKTEVRIMCAVVDYSDTKEELARKVRLVE